MATNHPEHSPDFNLVRGGTIDRVVARMNMAANTAPRRLMKVVMLLVVTWLPLLLLSLATGRALGERVNLPFLHDPEVQARYLIVLPLLELAEVIVAVSLAVQVRHLRGMGVVPNREQEKFDAACSKVLAVRGTVWSEAAILVLSFSLAFVIRVVLGVSEGDSSWERTGSVLTPAGWWHTLVSSPILYFFILRWMWIYLLWARFLFQVSRFELELTPTHPDRAGGLAFLGWGLASHGTVLMAVSTVFSAAFAQQILFHGESLDSLKYHVIAFIVAALAILYAPLLAFSGRLSRCRFSGLLEFGALVWRYDRAFEAKWIENSTETTRESILGNPDFQSLVDIAVGYDHIERMRMLPFDSKAFVVLALSAMIPMLPLIGTEIPLQEIFSKLAELLI
jgi:hypothetical protein